jgi:ribosome-associated heat shock protein Hsp15
MARVLSLSRPTVSASTNGFGSPASLRAKPARTIRVGDTLTITRGESRFEVGVHSLPTRRGPATEAQQAYIETPESLLQRERKREQLRIAPPAPFGRPDKQDRRALRSLRERNR